MSAARAAGPRLVAAGGHAARPAWRTRGTLALRAERKRACTLRQATEGGDSVETAGAAAGAEAERTRRAAEIAAALDALLHQAEGEALEAAADKEPCGGCRRGCMCAEAQARGLSSVDEALVAIARGGFAVVADDEARENEGDLIGAAGEMTAEALSFMVRHTSGIVCVGLPGERCDALALPLMVPQEGNEDSMGTAFTVTVRGRALARTNGPLQRRASPLYPSLMRPPRRPRAQVDLKEGTSTGISAADRAATLRALANPEAPPGWFNRPGHIFPLRARDGGVLERPGHTEAAVDLTRLAGCAPAGVLCELVNDHDGSVKRMPKLREFAAEHDLPLITVEQLCEYRRRHAN